MPSPLYSSTDRPDLVEGAYATHTHDASTELTGVLDVRHGGTGGDSNLYTKGMAITDYLDPITDFIAYSGTLEIGSSSVDLMGVGGSPDMQIINGISYLSAIEAGEINRWVSCVPSTSTYIALDLYTLSPTEGAISPLALSFTYRKSGTDDTKKRTIGRLPVRIRGYSESTSAATNDLVGCGTLVVDYQPTTGAFQRIEVNMSGFIYRVSTSATTAPLSGLAIYF